MQQKRMLLHCRAPTEANPVPLQHGEETAVAQAGCTRVPGIPGTHQPTCSSCYILPDSGQRGSTKEGGLPLSEHEHLVHTEAHVQMDHYLYRIPSSLEYTQCPSGPRFLHFWRP